MCIAAILSLIVISCTKVGFADEENPDAIDQNDDIFPVITVSKPTAGQVYLSGDSIVVQGKTTDDKIVYKGKVRITNDATSAIVAESYYESHLLTAIDFRLAYNAIVTLPTDFSILVEFRDHGANTSVATKGFNSPLIIHLPIAIGTQSDLIDYS